MPSLVSTQAFSRRIISPHLYWLQIQAQRNDSRGAVVTIVSLIITLVMISFIIQLLVFLRIVIFLYMLKSGYRLLELQLPNAPQRSLPAGDLDRVRGQEIQESVAGLQHLPVEELD
jgi:flagellar biosynthesis protein FliP